MHHEIRSKFHVWTIGKFKNEYNHELVHVDNEKDLEVIFDLVLKFEERIALEVIKDGKSLVKLYAEFIRPHQEYSQIVWSAHHIKIINQIENFQTRVDGYRRRHGKRVNLKIHLLEAHWTVPGFAGNLYKYELW